MTASTDQREAQLDRECERIMKMSVEEMAAEEGKTVEQLLEEGRLVKERIIANLKAKGLWK